MWFVILVTIVYSYTYELSRSCAQCRKFCKAENAILFFFAVSSTELSVDEVVKGRPVCVNIESVFVQTNQQVID